MKNKISGKIVALLLTLIIVATSGMPLYAKETGDKANSFRYENGQSIAKAVPFSTLSPNAWKKIDGKYYSGDGSVIEGAVAKGIDVSHHQGTVDWKTIIRNFYPDLDEAVKAAQKDLEKVKIEDEVTDVICDVCGRNMVVKYGPHGKFLACPGFPECRNTKPYLEKIGVTCPKCGKEVALRKTKKGRKYFGCEDNPECDFMSWSRPVAEKCPKCGGYMVIKGNKIVCADEQCGYVTDRKNVEKDSE